MRTTARTAALIGGTLLATVAAFASPALAAADDTYAVKILVLDPAGHPVAGIGVSDAEHQIGGTSNSAGRLVLRGVSNPPVSSTFCAELIPDTQHLAGPTGWAPACQSQPVVGGVETLTLRFGVGAALGGRLVDARTGAPIAGGRACRYEDENLTYPICFTADDDGRWVLPNLTPGTYGFTVDGVGAVSNPDAPHGYAGAHLLDGAHPLTLRSGRITSLGTTRLVPMVEFTGAVVDSTGAAAPGATVAVGNADGDPTTAFDSVEATTDADGHYADVLLPWVRSPHRLLCGHGGATPAHPTGLALRCISSNDAGLTVTTPFTLADGGALTGSVVGAPDNRFRVSVVIRTGNEDVAIPGFRTGGTTYRVDGVPAGSRTVTAGGRRSSAVTVQPDTVTSVPTITIGS